MPTVDYPFGVGADEARDPFAAKKDRLARRVEKNDLAKHDRDRELSDLKAVMRTPEGRRLVWRLLELSGVYRLSYQGNKDDAVFNDGRRSIGLVLMADLHEHCPELYNTMAKDVRREHLKRSADNG